MADLSSVSASVMVHNAGQLKASTHVVESTGHVILRLSVGPVDTPIALADDPEPLLELLTGAYFAVLRAKRELA